DGGDGGNDNRSWSGGAEGATSDPAVLRVRARQVRNAAALLLLARGARLWLWGDEVLRTQRGNNNPYCQDGPEWWFDWGTAEAIGGAGGPGGAMSEAGFTRFVRALIALRREHTSLRAAEWHHALLKRGPALPPRPRPRLRAQRPRPG